MHNSWTPTRALSAAKTERVTKRGLIESVIDSIRAAYDGRFLFLLGKRKVGKTKTKNQNGCNTAVDMEI